MYQYTVFDGIHHTAADVPNLKKNFEIFNHRPKVIEFISANIATTIQLQCSKWCRTYFISISTQCSLVNKIRNVRTRECRERETEMTDAWKIIIFAHAQWWFRTMSEVGHNSRSNNGKQWIFENCFKYHPQSWVLLYFAHRHTVIIIFSCALTHTFGFCNHISSRNRTVPFSVCVQSHKSL